MTLIPGLQPIPKKRLLKRNELANALRETGRSLKAEKPVDLAALSALIASWCEKRPADGARLKAFLDAAEKDTASGDRQAALKHFRATIKFVCNRNETKGE